MICNKGLLVSFKTLFSVLYSVHNWLIGIIIYLLIVNALCKERATKNHEKKLSRIVLFEWLMLVSQQQHYGNGHWTLIAVSHFFDRSQVARFRVYNHLNACLLWPEVDIFHFTIDRMQQQQQSNPNCQFDWTTQTIYARLLRITIIPNNNSKKKWLVKGHRG